MIAKAMTVVLSNTSNLLCQNKSCCHMLLLVNISKLLCFLDGTTSFAKKIIDSS